MSVLSGGTRRERGRGGRRMGRLCLHVQQVMSSNGISLRFTPCISIYVSYVYH